MSNLTKRENRLCAIVCNVMIVALEAVGALISTLSNGWTQFQFYTQNSNYIAMIISILFLIAAFRVGLNKSLPNWIVLLRYIAACLLSVTFLVIVFLLCPPYGPQGYKIALLTEAQVFQHLLCPILSFVSLLLFEDTPKQKGAALIAIVPTLLYAGLAVALNFARIWYGPYPFFHVYEQPWWQSILYAAVILLGAYIVAFFLHFGLKKRKTKE